MELPLIAGFGNPILDLCVFTKNNKIHKKYNFKEDYQNEISEDMFLSVLCDVKMLCDGKCYEVAGGSVQNTLRIFQWLFGKPGSSVMFGGIGCDNRGKFIEKAMKKTGVLTRYSYHKNIPSGGCIGLINGINRCLVASLGAANFYQPSDLFIEDHEMLLSNVKMIYIESFFLVHSFPVVKLLIEFCKEKEILLACNLNGEYVLEQFSNETKFMIEQSNFVFGNKVEFFTLAKSLNLIEQSIENISKVVHNMGHIEKTVVITQGKAPVLCLTPSSKDIIVYQVPYLDDSEVVDTTGAGDAFVAGFLTGYLKGRNIMNCLELGTISSREIIKQIGCKIPAKEYGFIK